MYMYVSNQRWQTNGDRTIRPDTSMVYGTRHAHLRHVAHSSVPPVAGNRCSAPPMEKCGLSAVRRLPRQCKRMTSRQFLLSITRVVQRSHGRLTGTSPAMFDTQLGQPVHVATNWFDDGCYRGEVTHHTVCTVLTENSFMHIFTFDFSGENTGTCQEENEHLQTCATANNLRLQMHFRPPACWTPIR